MMSAFDNDTLSGEGPGNDMPWIQQSYIGGYTYDTETCRYIHTSVWRHNFFGDSEVYNKTTNDRSYAWEENNHGNLLDRLPFRLSVRPETDSLDGNGKYSLYFDVDNWSPSGDPCSDYPFNNGHHTCEDVSSFDYCGGPDATPTTFYDFDDTNNQYAWEACCACGGGDKCSDHAFDNGHHTCEDVSNFTYCGGPDATPTTFYEFDDTNNRYAWQACCSAAAETQRTETTSSADQCV